MTDFFLKLLDISFSACFIICAVLFLRIVFKKAPSYVRCLMWALVGIRLIMPFSIESSISLVPDFSPQAAYTEQLKEDFTPPSTETVPDANRDETTTYPSAPTAPLEPPTLDTSTSDAPAQTTPIAKPKDKLALKDYAFMLWAAGALSMVIYMAISYARLKKAVKDALVYDEGVYIFGGKGTPFVIGVFRPRIYIPAGFDTAQIDCIVSHEKTHIRRLDHIFKPLAFFILAIHWFNPLAWLAYVLYCRDTELACDESVISGMSTEDRKLYSFTLLSCSNGRLGLSLPTAFGETAIKERVKKVMKYKKPSFLIIIAALIALTVAGILFITSPTTDVDDSSSEDTSEDSSSEEATDTLFNLETISELPGTGIDIFVYTDPFFSPDRVMITVNKTVKNFAYVELMHGEISGYHLGKTLLQKKELTPEMKFVLITSLKEEASCRGITYEDENGNTEILALLGDENGPYIKDINDRDHLFIEAAGLKVEIGELFANADFDYTEEKSSKCMRLSPLKEIRDFAFYKLGFSSSIGTVPKERLCYRESITKDKPFYAKLSLGNATHGFSITDDTGNTKYYAICIHASGELYFWDITKEANAYLFPVEDESSSDVYYDPSAEWVDVNSVFDNLGGVAHFSFKTVEEFKAWMKGEYAKPISYCYAYDLKMKTVSIYDYPPIESKREMFSPTLALSRFGIGGSLNLSKITCVINHDQSVNTVYDFRNSDSEPIRVTVTSYPEKIEGDIYTFWESTGIQSTGIFDFTDRYAIDFADQPLHEAYSTMTSITLKIATRINQSSHFYFVYDGMYVHVVNMNGDFTEREMNLITFN